MTTPIPGDFGLTQISGNVGKMIRFGQWLNGDGFANYEHAFIYIGDGKIVEAELPVTRIADLSEYDGNSIMWSTGVVKPTAMQRYNIVSFAKACVGTPYSVADYFSLAAKRLHIPFPGLTAYVKSSGHMICSQEVAYCYAQAGCPLLGNEFTGDVTPGDLHRLLVQLSASTA